VALGHQLANARRGHPDAALMILDLLGDSDAHAALLVYVGDAPTVGEAEPQNRAREQTNVRRLGVGIRTICEDVHDSTVRDLDAIDRRIVQLLQGDGRMPNAKLAAAVDLSPSSCLRRVRLLERDGVIRGYTALVEADEPDRATTVLVEIVLERQTAESMSKFESAVRRFPEVRECYLMSGTSDYLLRVQARDAADYERIHSEHLSRLPGVARVRSSFAIRTVTRRR
jgi:DNA-binding Lrp family transcriptional regulator